MPELSARRTATAKKIDTSILNPLQQQNVRYIAEQHAPLHRTSTGSFEEPAAELPSRHSIVYRTVRYGLNTTGMGHGWNGVGGGDGSGGVCTLK